MYTYAYMHRCIRTHTRTRTRIRMQIRTQSIHTHTRMHVLCVHLHVYVYHMHTSRYIGTHVDGICVEDTHIFPVVPYCIFWSKSTIYTKSVYIYILYIYIYIYVYIYIYIYIDLYCTTIIVPICYVVRLEYDIELVHMLKSHSNITLKFVARRISGMPCGLCYVAVLSV